MVGPQSFNPIQTTDRNSLLMGDCALDSWGAPDQTFNGWTYDPTPAAWATTPVLATTNIYMHKIKVPVSTTSSKCTFIVTAIDASITAGTAALYTDAGVKIAETGSLLTNANGSKLTSITGVTFPTWVTPVAITPGYYHVAFRFTRTGTSTLKLAGCIPTNAGGFDIANMGSASAANYRYAIGGTGTTMPSSITMSSRTAFSGAYTWFAI